MEYMTHKQKTGGAEFVGKRTAKAADKRGPKAGSARASQSVKLSAADQKQITAEATSRKAAAPKKSDVISAVKNTTSGGDYTMVSAPGMETLAIPSVRFIGEVQKLAVKGGSYKAVKAAWEKAKAEQPPAKLAKGVDGRNSPHSAKAVSDGRGKAEAPAKKPAAPKAEKKAVASTGGPDRKYKATKKEDNSKPDSYRRHMISTIRAHTTTSAAKAAHVASGKFSHERLNFKWAHDNGYIVLADLA